MRNPHRHWPALIQIVQNQTIDYTTLLNAPKSCKMINCVARGEMECRLRSGLLTWPQPALRNPTVEPLEPQQAPLCSRMRCCDTGPGRFWGVRIFPDFLLSFFWVVKDVFSYIKLLLMQYFFVGMTLEHIWNSCPFIGSEWPLNLSW